MPLIQLDTSCEIGSTEKKTTLTQALSRVAADCIGKPEQYVMACVHDNVAMTMSGTGQPSALVTVRSIGGLNRTVNQKLATAAGQVLERELGITGDRVYCVFEERPATHWAWQGRPFG